MRTRDTPVTGAGALAIAAGAGYRAAMMGAEHAPIIRGPATRRLHPAMLRKRANMMHTRMGA